MAYNPTVYANDNPPAINSDNLNHMEQGIYDVSIREEALNDAVRGLSDISGTYTEKSVYQTVDGWKLIDRGLCTQDSAYQLKKFVVTAGSVIKLVTEGMYQFQNSSSVPSTGNPTRIGYTYTGANGIYTVPTGATYLIVSLKKNYETVSCYDVSGAKNLIDAQKLLNEIQIKRISDLNNIIQNGVFESDTDWENGGIGLSSGNNYANAKAIRTKYYLKFDAAVRICKSMYDSTYSNHNVRLLKYSIVDGVVSYVSYSGIGNVHYVEINGNDLNYYYRITIENATSGATTIDPNVKNRIHIRVDNYYLNNDKYANEVYKKNRIDAEIISGMIGTTGSTSSSFRHCTATVEEGETYYINGWCMSSYYSYPLLYVKNGSGIIIDAIGNSDRGYLSYKYTIPKGGVELYVNGRDAENRSLYAPKIFKEEVVGASHISEGKSIGVGFGDSLMEGVGVLLGFSTPAAPVDDVVSQMKPLLNADLYNAGIGGGTYSNLHFNNFGTIVDAIISGDWTDVNSIIATAIAETDLHNGLNIQFDKIKALDFSKVDFIFINYGTNDWNSGYILDNENDLYDRTTILGGLRYGIKALLEEFPQLRIYVFTPAYRWAYDGQGQETWNSDTARRGSENLTLPDVCGGIIEAMKNMKIPCKDFYDESNVNEFTRSYYLIDGTHRNAIGYGLMAEQYSRFIMSK